MAQTHGTPTPRAPVSPSTSPDGGNISRARETSFPSSHTPTYSTVTGVLVAPMTPSSSSMASNMRAARRANSKVLPPSRVTTSNSPSDPTPLTESILTMNDVTTKISNLLPDGYYRCAGQSKTTSRCKRQIKNKSYCHSHDIQLLDAISHNKDCVIKTIMEVRSHKGPMIDDKLAGIHGYLLARHWDKIHVSNFEGLLRNIKKGPLEVSERDQGCHALVPRWDRLYVCRGRGKGNRSCGVKTVGAFYCRHHDPSRITAGDVEMAFAEI